MEAGRGGGSGSGGVTCVTGYQQEVDMEILGIDIGGTGIKGAPVDVEQGVLTAERYRLLTPQPATPDAVADMVVEVVSHFRWKGPVGCAFPAVIKDGVACTAAHVDPSWIGVDAQQLLRKKTQRPVCMLNDADAAGIAEMTFGVGAGYSGVVILITLGTGIGSALFLDGRLVPNTELGHIEIRGKEAEYRASNRARQVKNLCWRRWAIKVDEYLKKLEALLSPDLFIIGGGVSQKHTKFFPFLHPRTPFVPAQLLNEAGIVGAALAARGLAPAARARIKARAR
jgi:polyphosphate glucokinase